MFDIKDCVGIFATNESKKIGDNFNSKLKEKGLTRVQWIALFYLGEAEDLSQTILGKKMNIRNSTVVALIDRLEREKLIIRKKHDLDRRKTLISLTELGKDTREKTMYLGETFNENLRKNIDNEDLQIFKKVFKKIVENSKKNL
ncbi:MarR family transcriptional regulator [Psychrilyobacter sp.]|uniref:MarR family winged helix-turn-helix transcriptional regulator n=1 Tax=Psychrilyobacter sp. TaxID=2586924 RepID=UPI00301A6E5E